MIKKILKDNRGIIADPTLLVKILGAITVGGLVLYIVCALV